MESKRSFPSLTALKGLFIFIIVFHNSLSSNTLFSSVPGVAFIRQYGGILGDTMFFMLSGFLLSHSYRDRIQGGTISFKDFLLRRLKKLYPLYLITNAAALILAIRQYGVSVLNIQKTVFTILLQIGGGLEQGVPYNAPTWFLSPLFVCYIVFYAVAFYVKKPSQYVYAIVLSIIWGYILMAANLAIPFFYSGNGLALVCFFIGCSFAEVYPLITRQMHKWLRPVSFLVLILFLFLLFNYGIDIISGDFSVACAFVLCPLILYLALAETWCSKLLQQKPFLLLGKTSMHIFFWHMVLYSMMTQLVPGGELGEMGYVMYLLVLVVWCGMSNMISQKGLHSFLNRNGKS